MKYLKSSVLALGLTTSPAFAYMVANGGLEQPSIMTGNQYPPNGDFGFIKAADFAQFQYLSTAGSSPANTINTATSTNPTWSLNSVSFEFAAVPAPAAAWSFLTGLMGVLALKRRKQRNR